MSHFDRRVTVASVLSVLVAGCTASVTTGPAAPLPPPPPPPPVAYGEPPPDGDLVYETQAPVADVDTYPTAVYGGVTVYYVGGTWYRRGPQGWARYRVEPPELARERASHEREPRWVRAREAPGRPGIAESQPGDRRRPPPPEPERR